MKAEYEEDEVKDLTLLYLFVQIFVFENNIYYRATVESRSIRLVSTGKEGVVFNGLADWLYEGKTTSKIQLFSNQVFYEVGKLSVVLEFFG